MIVLDDPKAPFGELSFEVRYGLRLVARDFDAADELAAQYEAARKVREKRDAGRPTTPDDYHAETSIAFAKRMIVGWEGVVDSAGEPVPVTPDSLDKVIRKLPGVASDFYTAFYTRFNRWSAEGNASPPSPSGTGELAPSGVATAA
jgi:hypothetical protein